MQGKIFTRFNIFASVALHMSFSTIDRHFVNHLNRTLSTLPWELCFWWQSPFLGVGQQVLAHSESLLCCCHKRQGCQKEHLFSDLKMTLWFKNDLLESWPNHHVHNWKYAVRILCRNVLSLFFGVGVVHDYLFKNIVCVWIPRTYWECEVDT